MRAVKIAAILLVFLLLLAGCGSGQQDGGGPAGTARGPAGDGGISRQELGQLPSPGQAAQEIPGGLRVHFLDVGQADSILLQFPGGRSMLVDAGNNEDGPFVVAYLKQQGVSKIDYLVGTHPHEDHIGGLDDVIRSFAVGQVFMPRVTASTKTFEEVLQAVKEKGLKISTARAGVTLFDQGDLKVDFVAPNGADYEDLNNWSAVTRIRYGDTAFLLTGDAGARSEKEMLASGANLRADVLKVGHHGSSSSTTPAFLRAVAPKYAVISVGAGNDYGHPHQETLARLKDAGVQVFRTDLDGTVVFVSDGKTVQAAARGKDR